nr:uncharacterized protein LOC113808688 [Penaeus vannamei]
MLLLVQAENSSTSLCASGWGSGSAPDSDGISYPIISHLGLAGELAFLQLINKPWPCYPRAGKSYISHPKTKGARHVLTHFSPQLSGQNSREEDQEKAFELANPLAIKETLIHMGIRGRLLAWITDYFDNRAANVRFQGHLSQYMLAENGMPQGEVLIPALFNTLIQHTQHTSARGMPHPHVEKGDPIPADYLP